jgi:hypothetical protein
VRGGQGSGAGRAGEEGAFGGGLERVEAYASGAARPGEAAESPGEHDRPGGSDHAAAWRGVCSQLQCADFDGCQGRGDYGVGGSQAANDTGELVPAMERMEANWSEVPLQIVVDGAGFINQGTIMAMEAQRMDLIGPLPNHASQPVAALEKQGVASEFFPQAFSL